MMMMMVMVVVVVVVVMVVRHVESGVRIRGTGCFLKVLCGVLGSLGTR